MATIRRRWSRPRLALCSMSLLIVLLFTLLPFQPAALASHTPQPVSVNLAGNLESEATSGACGDWDPACAGSRFAAQPNSVYLFNAASIPAGSYEYKVALGSWAENYGSNYQQDGPNINVTLSSTRGVRFYYDHKTHYIADNVRNTIYTVPGNYGPYIGCSQWAPECLGSLMSDTDGDGTFTFVTDKIAEGTYEFKIATNESWSNPNYGAGGGPNNISFTVPGNAGYVVTFSFNSNTHQPGVSVGSTAPQQDNNVQYFGLGHNSQDTLYRTPFGAVNPGTEVTLRFRTFHDDVSGVQVRFYDTATSREFFQAMRRAATDVSCYDVAQPEARCDFWETSYTPAALSTLYYRFVVTDGTATAYYADDRFKDGGWGTATPAPIDNSYVVTVFDPAFKPIPWLRDAVIYQIFPDRFRNGRKNNDPQGTESRYGYAPEPSDQIIFKAWDELPEGYCRKYVNPATPCAEQPRGRDYFGGDLRGIDQKLDYLKALGVTALYFNPIFDAASDHAYDTQDYFRVDPFFGTQKDWEDLEKHARQLGIRIILDGVFNHVSSDSPYFDRYGHFTTHGACENVNSPYRSWFYFRPQANGPCAGPDGPATMTYDAWFGFDSLPVLNKNEPSVRDLFYEGSGSVGRHWLNQGGDAWRLDVMGDGSFPDSFWQEFRTAIKGTNANAPIIGELWKKEEILPKIHGDMADTTMNYRFRNAILGFFGTVDDKGFADDGQSDQPPSLFARKLQSLREDYPDATYFTLMNLMDSHDTARILWSLTPGERNGEAREFNATNLALGKARLRLATLVQMTVPGAPTIYYGDEVAVTGDDDPDDRRTFPWGGTGAYESGGDPAILAWYTKLAKLRHTNGVLRTGEFDFLLADDSARTLAYARRDGDKLAIVAINRNEAGSQTLAIPLAGYLRDGVSFTDAINGGGYTSGDGKLTLTLPALGGALLFVDAGQDLAGPGAPTNLSATAGNGVVKLAWNAGSDAASYNVYRSPVSGGGYTLAGTTTGATFDDTSVVNGKPYFYVVRGLDAPGNEGERSNEAAATPSFPIGYAVLQHPKTVNIIRSVDGTPPIYGQVYVAGLTDAGAPPAGILAQLGYGSAGSNPAGWTTWVDMSFNVKAGNNYEYAAKLVPEVDGTFDLLVRFSTDGGATWTYGDQDGAYPGEPGTDMPGVLTVAPNADTTPPAAPADLRIDDWSANFIKIAWDPVADAAQYRIYRSTTAGSFDDSQPLAKVDSSTTSYTDSTMGSGTTYFYIVRAYDAALNASGNSNQVSQTAGPKLVAVTFRVRVPAETPPGDTIYIPGNIDLLGPWNPGKQPMVDKGGGIWEATLQILDGTVLEYKYTRGTWDLVEWWGSIVSTANRQVSISYGSDGTQLVDDTATNWGSGADTHKAVQYWRDPLVASTTPANGSSGAAPASVTVTFSRSIQPPAGGNFDNSVVVRQGSSTVVGTVTSSGGNVLIWTPAVPLAAGTYTATVSGVRSDLAGDSVPMQAPYTFTFTVQ